MTVLSMRNVSVDLGGARVLDGVSIDVAAGEVVGIQGANGSGKTTLLDVISGLTPAWGTVSINDVDVSSMNAGQRSRFVSRGFQGAPLFPSLTVKELAAVAGGAAGNEHVAGKFISELSTGTRRLVELDAIEARDKAVILLDEPAAGLAREEREAAIDRIRGWAEEGHAIVVVEHDSAFLSRVSDRTLKLSAGRLSGDSPPTSNGHARADEPGVEVAAIVDVINEVADRPLDVPPAVPARTYFRLGLRHLSAGMLSVLTLGVLNRVMKVELGIPLWVTACVLASYNLAAPLAVAAGRISDRRPFMGRHRTPYILGGAALTAVATALAPYAALNMSRSSGFASAILMLLLFFVMGTGMYSSGAAYLALIADVTEERERGRASSIVYSMLMVGILAGVGLSVGVLNEYSEPRLKTLFLAAGVILFVLTAVAVAGVERPGRQIAATARTLTSIVRALKNRYAIAFFMFVVTATFFAFLQQAVLEPFGAEVFDLGVRRTTIFNAIQIIGVLGGMAVAGRISRRIAKKSLAAAGLVISAVSFVMLSAAAPLGSLALVETAIFVMGVGLGVLNVGALSLMMDMTVGGAVGMYMGAWTVAHALADGLATAGGGILFDALRTITGSVQGAYSLVFAIEAAGLLLTLKVLARVDVPRFRDTLEQG